ncbi:MAG: hypothetical protein N2C14_05140 [Planctomycetales bacterium]
MIRSFFLGVGAFAVILGVECLAIDEVAVRSTKPPEKQETLRPFSSSAAVTNPTRKLPDWAPWSLMSGGAVTILY